MVAGPKLLGFGDSDKLASHPLSHQLKDFGLRRFLPSASGHRRAHPLHAFLTSESRPQIGAITEHRLFEREAVVSDFFFVASAGMFIERLLADR